MCGIIGYTGRKNAQDIILDGLHSLEYRGYDSAGMTVFDDGKLLTVKTQGRVSELENMAKGSLKDAFCGIGHTRWATHGKPSAENAHPHGTESIMLVHNGIIENYKEIKDRLSAEGCVFKSDTDTEAAALLLDSEYKRSKNCIRAIIDTVKQLGGAYALGIVFKDEPDTVYAVKKDSSMLIGIGDEGNFIASDISAFIKHTKKYIRPDDGEIVKITKDCVSVFDGKVNPVKKEVRTADWSESDAGKAGFNHFMMKEIFEQPRALTDTLNSLSKDGLPDFSTTIDDDSFFENIGTVHIVACGTAMHAGFLGKYYIENLARIPVNVEIASEFRYKNPILRKNDLVIIISQSGETADSLAALRLVKERNIRTLSIVNTVGSTIARESNYVIYTKAGPEIAVASTKAFSVQVLVLLIAALKMAEKTGEITPDKEAAIIENLRKTAAQSLHNVLSDMDKAEKAAKIIAKHRDVFFIGRGYDYYMGLEASLKLKEISYIHSEAYAAGELKHGTISLIEEGTPVIAIAADEKNNEKLRSNIEEVKSRGAFVISVCSENDYLIKDTSDVAITVPPDDILLRPFTAAAAVQLLAYYTALELGRDIDKPRNLAKSVTVE